MGFLNLPERSVNEPWWRWWVWACLPGFCGTLGAVIGASAGYFGLMLYDWSKGQTMGGPDKFSMLVVLLAGTQGGISGLKIGEAAVKKLRGRSGEPPIPPEIEGQGPPPQDRIG